MTHGTTTGPGELIEDQLGVAAALPSCSREVPKVVLAGVCCTDR